MKIAIFIIIFTATQLSFAGESAASNVLQQTATKLQMQIKNNEFVIRNDQTALKSLKLSFDQATKNQSDQAKIKDLQRDIETRAQEIAVLTATNKALASRLRTLPK